MIKVKKIEPRCLSIADLAKYLGVSRSLVHRDYPQWVNEYQIRAYVVGGKLRKRIVFEKQDIDNRLLPRLRMQGGINDAIN